MFGLGITVCQMFGDTPRLLAPVHTFADSATAQGFIDANSTHTVRLVVGEGNPRVLYERTERATLSDLVAVHLVR